MSEIIRDIINALPKWLLIVAFLLLVVCIFASLFLGVPLTIFKWKIGYEWKVKDSIDESQQYYLVYGTVKTSNGEKNHEIGIEPKYEFSSASVSYEGTIVGLEVWKNPRGKFPTIYFTHKTHIRQPLDLNNRKRVSVVKFDKDTSLRITGDIVLNENKEP